MQPSLTITLDGINEEIPNTNPKCYIYFITATTFPKSEPIKIKVTEDRTNYAEYFAILDAYCRAVAQIKAKNPDATITITYAPNYFLHNRGITRTDRDGIIPDFIYNAIEPLIKSVAKDPSVDFTSRIKELENAYYSQPQPSTELIEQTENNKKNIV